MNHPELYDERHLCDGDWPEDPMLEELEDDWWEDMEAEVRKIDEQEQKRG